MVYLNYYYIITSEYIYYCIPTYVNLKNMFYMPIDYPQNSSVPRM